MLKLYPKSISSKFFESNFLKITAIILMILFSYTGFSAPKEDYPPLSEEKLAHFNEAKAALKELFQKELKEKIKRNPANKAQYKKDYEQSYNETLADLKRNYALGNIEIYREWMFPGISGTSPTGSGMEWGQVALWGVYTFKDMYSNKNDAGAGFSFGLGNPDKYIGIQNTLDFQDLYTAKNGKRYDLTKAPDFSIGAYHLSLHRNLPGNLALGFGESYVASYGYESQIDVRRSEHLVLTHYYVRGLPHEYFSILQFSFGLGRGGGFVDDDTRVNKNGKIRSIIAPFFSVGTRVAPPLGLGIEYEAKRINAFINITPFRSFPFALSLLAINLNKAGGLNKMISVSGSFFYDFISR